MPKKTKFKTSVLKSQIAPLFVQTYYKEQRERKLDSPTRKTLEKQLAKLQKANPELFSQTSFQAGIGGTIVNVNLSRLLDILTNSNPLVNALRGEDPIPPAAEEADREEELVAAAAPEVDSEEAGDVAAPAPEAEDGAVPAAAAEAASIPNWGLDIGDDSSDDEEDAAASAPETEGGATPATDAEGGATPATLEGWVVAAGTESWGLDVGDDSSDDEEEDAAPAPEAEGDAAAAPALAAAAAEAEDAAGTGFEEWVDAAGGEEAAANATTDWEVIEPQEQQPTVAGAGGWSILGFGASE